MSFCSSLLDTATYVFCFIRLSRTTRLEAHTAHIFGSRGETITMLFFLVLETNCSSNGSVFTYTISLHGYWLNQSIIVDSGKSQEISKLINSINFSASHASPGLLCSRRVCS